MLVFVGALTAPHNLCDLISHLDKSRDHVFAVNNFECFCFYFYKNHESKFERVGEQFNVLEREACVACVDVSGRSRVNLSSLETVTNFKTHFRSPFLERK